MMLLQENGDTFINVTDTDFEFTSTEKQKQGVMDWNGDLIWECPFNMKVEGFDIALKTGISHIMLEFTPKYQSSRIGQFLTGSAFNYDCRHPGLFVDSYQDYVLKNRDYDIEMRQIQADKEVWTQVGASLEGVGYGIAFGQTMGGIAAGIGGVLETVSRKLINDEFNPKIQKQYDKLYARMTDQISLVGDAITALLWYEPLYKYTLTMDDATQNRMKSDIEINGFYIDEIVSDLSSMFTNQPTEVGEYTVYPVFQADNVVIEGACNVIGKQQVVSRLMNGVEFI